MKIIPEEIVERTWREVAGFSPVRANTEMMKIGKNQPELIAFVTELREKTSQEVKELGVYLFFVVYRMFQKTQGKIKRVSSQEVIECHEHNESLMERLEGAHKRFLDRAARIQISKQPFVMKYVIDALMEDAEGADAQELTDEDRGFLFVLLKTVIDVLDQKGVSLT